MTRSIDPGAWRAQPWRNGGGITHEIARWPEQGDPYDVRISLAEVARSGPFSQFPGYRRWSVLADERAEIALVTAAGTRRLTRLGEWIELDGAAAIEAEVAAPVHLLNVLARPGVEVGVGAPPSAVRFAFALAAVPELARWHALVFDPPARLDRRALVWVR